MRTFVIPFFIVLLALFSAFINIEVLSMLAFFVDGMMSFTFPMIFTFIRGGQLDKEWERCHNPWVVQKLLHHLERSLENNTLHTNSTPVREVEFAYRISRAGRKQICEETLWSTQGGRLAPFVARGKKTFHEFSPDWLLQNFSNISVLATDMKAIDDLFTDTLNCPYKRKALAQNLSLGDMPWQTQFYANFNQDTLQNIYMEMRRMNNSDYFRFINRQLLHMCDAFGGIDGELFFGWTSSSSESASGTGFHAAVMENIFLQVQGERNWTLVDPRYTMRMRPMHGARYIQGARLYDEGWTTLKRPTHWNSIPKMTVTTRPGDILFIPAWWWHEIRIEDDSFSLGISNRNHMRVDSWRHSPILRFLPGILSIPSVGAGLMPILLDAVHYTPDIVVLLLFQTGAVAENRLSDIIKSGRVQQVQHQTNRQTV